MTARPALVVGLMSGTSLDGMDAALVRLRSATEAELVGFVHRRYTTEQREELLRALEGEATPRDYAKLHVRLADWAGEAVERLLAQTKVKATDLAGIGFPGQTLWHEPPIVSWQLGEPAVLVERFGTKVVSGFRASDVAAGGRAPRSSRSPTWSSSAPRTIPASSSTSVGWPTSPTCLGAGCPKGPSRSTPVPAWP